MQLAQKRLIAILSIAFTCVFFINYCNIVFGCGCTYLWAGAADHCNIHHGPKHCPFCVVGTAGQLMVWLTMVTPQALISFWPSPWSFLRRSVLALLAFPVFGAIPAIVLGVYQGYWN